MRTTKFFLLAAFAAASAFSQCALVYNPFMNTWDCGGASGTVGGATNLTVAGAIPFVSTPGVLTTAPTQLFWDPVNFRLGVGTNTPSVSFQVAGPSIIQGLTVGRGGGAISSNTAVGASALAANTTGSSNTATGLDALAANTTGANNTAIGWLSMPLNTTGASNTAVGRTAMSANTSGTANTALGTNALLLNTTGNSNTAAGFEAMRANTTGLTNAAFGREAMRSNTTGSNNVAIGHQAGETSTSANANTTGSNNTWIGYQSGPASSTQRSGSVAIGAGALVNASNAGVLGTAGMKWSVGGVQAPAATFHIEDTTASTGVTSLLIKAGGGQATNSLMSWQNSAGATLGLINQVGTVVAPAFTNGPQNFILGSLSTQYSSGYVLSFGPNATAGSSDTGISRNGVGLIEINSGTAGQYRDITYRIAQWRNGTEATCDVTTRGQVVMVQGGAGVADTLRVCAKDAADAYAWTALY